MNGHPKGHWRCPDCGLWCACDGFARDLPHQPCKVQTQASIDEGMRRAYESWQRAHVVPGGHDE